MTKALAEIEHGPVYGHWYGGALVPSPIKIREKSVHEKVPLDSVLHFI